MELKNQIEFIFDLPKIEDERGNLSFLEVETHVPFPIVRTYWIYDVPGGEQRGSHAFKTQHEIVVALSGSFDIVLHDGKKEKRYTLNRAYKALYIPSMMWKTLDNFSTNSVCLVLNSGAYSKDEYIRSFEDFRSKAMESRNTEPVNIEIPAKDLLPQYNTVSDCSLLQFPSIKNRAGNIVSLESLRDTPFDIQRVFHIYDIPSGSQRGMHAHMHCHELLFATTGSFEVELDDGKNKRTMRLNSPNCGLHIPPGVWASEKEYSSGATCLVLASQKYSKEGYINTYESFKQYRENEDKDIHQGR